LGEASWKTSDGKAGIEPQAEVVEVYKLTDKFLQHPVGTPGSDAIGKKILVGHDQNLWKIGPVGPTKVPFLHRNSLGHFHPFNAKSYDYYWADPYRGFQWFLKKSQYVANTEEVMASPRPSPPDDPSVHGRRHVLWFMPHLILGMVIPLFLVSIIVFFLIELPPGDYADRYAFRKYSGTGFKVTESD
ncbi:hypothetical protein, partial [Oceanidesulfovibrio marinus]|uniref:hypothetical protein n=1 Tax=Oceanidesulfovibrio marinus TaxID=370038 RepID=UPI001ABF045F